MLSYGSERICVVQTGDTMAYNIIFYERENGKSDVWNFLEALREKSFTSKDARIQYRQIILYIELLQNNGTMLPEDITKHIEDNIWELRPGNNRIFYFCYDSSSFVLLHSFRKKTQKTPRREINRAKAERDDYLARK
jgi:phage-related protein